MEQLQPQIGAAPATAALKSLRLAKTFWSLLIILAILIHLAAFVMVEWAGVADTKSPKAMAGQATTKKAGEQKPEPNPASVIKDIMDQAMPIAKLAAPVSCGILVAVLALAVLVAIADGTGDTGGFVSAFLWGVILLVMLTPWQNLLRNVLVYGALYDGGLDDIKNTKEAWVSGRHVADQILYFGRFVAYPVIALLVWILVQAKFARGFKGKKVSPKVTVIRPPGPQGQQR